MARLDRARLSAGIFPYEVEVPTRFTDVDVLQHINNVAVTAIFQEGRSRFARTNDLVSVMKGCGLVVASMIIEFAEEMRHPDPIHLSMGLLEVGRTSYRIAQVARQNGRIGAFAEVVQVANANGAAVPFNDEWRSRLESLKATFPA